MCFHASQMATMISAADPQMGDDGCEAGCVALGSGVFVDAEMGVAVTIRINVISMGGSP